MQPIILAALIAINTGLYELPPAVYTSGVEGAKQAALEAEEYLVRVRGHVEDAHERGEMSPDVWEDYEFLDEAAGHYQHLFVMSVLFYEEAPVEDPYGQMVTRASQEMISRIMLIQSLLMGAGIETPETPEGLFVRADSPMGWNDG